MMIHFMSTQGELSCRHMHSHALHTHTQLHMCTHYTHTFAAVTTYMTAQNTHEMSTTKKEVKVWAGSVHTVM